MSTFHFNTTFKKTDLSSVPGRSPTPPTRFIEPLSPLKPRPIEPTFNYPAINNHVNFHVHPKQAYAATPKSGNHNGTHKTSHHRTPSTIDTLAEAALAVSPAYPPQAVRTSDVDNFARPATYGHGRSEPPHKRARSEVFPPHFGSPSVSRPATSYEHNFWNRGIPQHGPTTDSYEKSRIEEAHLLLEFMSSNATRNPLPRPPPTMPTAARPHANSFPQDFHHQPRPIDLATSAGLLPAFNPQHGEQPRLKPPFPQQAVDEADLSSTLPAYPATHSHTITQAVPTMSDVQMEDTSAPAPAPAVAFQIDIPSDNAQTRTSSVDVTMSEASETAPKTRRGWLKGKSRGAKGRGSTTDKAAVKRAASRKKTPERSRAGKNMAEASAAENVVRVRRKSLSDIPSSLAHNEPSLTLDSPRRAKSVPRDTPMLIRPAPKSARRANKVLSETVCAGCATIRETKSLHGQMDEWVSCNGCKKWFHVDCAGFKKAAEVRDVDKYFCSTCEPKHGKTTFVRKSTRAHASVDYAELQRGVLKTSEESHEHHYIQPIKDGTFTFEPEFFPRMRPELVTREFFERSNAFVEPICIPAEWNPRPWAQERRKHEAGDEQMCDGGETHEMDDLMLADFEYDVVADVGQDRLGMVMPRDLTVRQVCNLAGPETPLDVIDVKTQNSGSKWNLAKWADYYEEESDDKPVRNVISLEVSLTKLGRLLRRPKVVRDIDLQDQVWPQKEIDLGKYPKVQFYCLMSVADSYTDFHIDFGGSSVYYHILKGKKTFFFIPPKTKHLKAYEDWNDSPQQNYTFLGDITGECYRVDLSEGDTMLIPSGWIHAVWTPETSLVIGGNFLTRMSYKNQFKVVDIEKANGTPMKFRYPYFQKIMWYTTIQYLESDPLPDHVKQLFLEGNKFEREKPTWADWDGDVAANDDRPGLKNARYYSQAEIEGLPDLVNYIFHTVMLVAGRVEGISADRMKRVNASIPKGHGEPLEIAKAFALWVAWKCGNENPPAWAHPNAVLPSQEEGPPKKLSARALKEMQRKEAFAAWKIAPDRQSARVKNATATTAANNTTAAIGSSTPERHHTSENPSHQPGHLPQPPPPSDSTLAHQDMDIQAPHVASPMALMMNGIPGHHISTPKTSVLGPKRIACDACRKRRIRCKHKDMVLQATPDQMQHINGDGAFGVLLAPDILDNITVTPPKARVTEVLTDTADHQHANSMTIKNGNSTVLVTGAPFAVSSPSQMNGGYNGDAPKRGRSKACFECRKSKRRCIHDENGNVDPIKAAEIPVPRGQASKKRPAGDEPDSTPAKKKTKPTAAATGVALQPQPVGSFQPAPNRDQSQRPPSMNGYHPASMTQTDDTAMHSSGGPPQSQTAIDPNLFAFAEPERGDLNHAYHYHAGEQSDPYQFQSLEQIAHEVLNMNGRPQEEEEEPEHLFDMSNRLPTVDGAKPDDSVDSAISIPGSEDGKPQADDARDTDIQRPLSRDDAKPPHSSTPHSLPLYQPPAPISLSPQLSKKPSTVAVAVEEYHPTEQDKVSEVDDESIELAKTMQQDDLGLRPRSK